MKGRLVFQTMEMSFPTLLQNTRLRHATDPRDKIFSLLRVDVEFVQFLLSCLPIFFLSALLVY